MWYFPKDFSSTGSTRLFWILVIIASHLKVDISFITNVAHVCHRWHVTLLSCPSLWTNPNFEQRGQALSFLHQSLEPLPISINPLTSTFHSESFITGDTGINTSVACWAAGACWAYKPDAELHTVTVHHSLFIQCASFYTLTVLQEHVPSLSFNLALSHLKSSSVWINQLCVLGICALGCVLGICALGCVLGMCSGMCSGNVFWDVFWDSWFVFWDAFWDS